MLEFSVVNIACIIFNLLVLYLIFKKFLFDRVDKVVMQRKEEVDEATKAADLATQKALETKKEYEEKIALADEEKEQIDWVWDMYYGEIAMTPDWNTLTLFTGDWEDDGTLNYGKWNLPELESAVRAYIGADDENRPAAESEMLQTIYQNSVFIPVCFEKREAISHIGVIKGMVPNQYNLFTNITNWTVNLD